MGYESKLYICKRIKIGEGLCYNEVLAAMNMCKMDSSFVRLFDKTLDGDFFGMDGDISRFDQRGDEDEPKLVDNYGDELKYASLDDVMKWCDDYYVAQMSAYPYRRIIILRDMLHNIEMWFPQIGNEQLIVVHCGY